MEVDAHSGARLDDAVFDINRDGVIDDDDWIEVTINGETIKLPPSGKRYDEMVRTPGIIERPDGDIEYKYLSGSSGGITVTLEKGSGQAIGRQSWREID